MQTLRKIKRRICKAIGQLRYSSINKSYIGKTITQFRNDSINKKYVRNNGAILQEIEIETLNRCNGICPFCPVNANMPQREYHKMTMELFKKIIDNLEKMNFSGNISLFSNNEPLLDDRIIEFHKYAWEHLPKAKHCLYTNGTLLNLEKFKSLIQYLDFMTIDNYNDDLQVNDSLKEVYEYIQTHEEIKHKVNFWIRKQNEILLSRGGQAPNKSKCKCLKELCLLPFRMMIVRPDGKVSLCCTDALGKYTMGDLNNETIEEIWNGDKFTQVRNTLIKKGRRSLNICNACDTSTAPAKYGKEN